MLDKDISDKLLINLGNRIREIRIHKNLSLTDVSNGCGMEKATLSKIETGKVNISFLTIYRLSQCLEVSISEITGEFK